MGPVVVVAGCITHTLHGTGPTAGTEGPSDCFGFYVRVGLGFRKKHPKFRAKWERWAGPWIGSALGMVAADALAIVVGRQRGTRLPERTVKIGAAIAFVAFVIYLITDGLLTTSPVLCSR